MSTALRKYIQVNLKNVSLKNRKSSAGAPELFVLKKNGKLQICMDYRGLDVIMIRDSYSLPFNLRHAQTLKEGEDIFKTWP